MKKILICLLFFILFIFGSDRLMASPIAKTWVYATVLIQNQWGARGTGFLIYREIRPGVGRIFLCTNKHVLDPSEELRQKASYIICFLNVKTPDGKIVGKPFTVGLIAPNGERRWREHPDENVDVLAFDITDLIIKYPEIVKKWGDYNNLADKTILSAQDITIGDDIFVIGYPLGERQGKTYFPIVRQGIIASQIGEEFAEDQLDMNGKSIQKTYRGFLIDGGFIPGSSGSPVVLKPETGRFIGNKIVMGDSPAYLLGILANTLQLSTIHSDKGFIGVSSGLGFAFDAVTIKETIELFFK
jgi:hypothetical protein